ncbi:hypothetical protein M8J75_003406 [Diaphorina citri]|nr:hypothetical protein M8J75_003406 [Diaphorina citri]KAI5738324.1 hypothetical protein M8J77_005484 [Diaphorina citri]
MFLLMMTIFPLTTTIFLSMTTISLSMMTMYNPMMYFIVLMLDVSEHEDNDFHDATSSDVGEDENITSPSVIVNPNPYVTRAGRTYRPQDWYG